MSAAALRAPIVLLCLALWCGASSSIAEPSTGENAPRATPVSSIATATPKQLTVRPQYVGSYNSDGVFKKLPGNSFWNTHQAQSEVPPNIDRGPFESVVEDNRTPARSVKRLNAHSWLGDLRDQIVTWAYGRPRILGAPTHIVVDSHQRLIITDPKLVAIHVLDDRNSFRIQGGPGRRLQHPDGLAVDANDNIYVTNVGNPLILVYDAQGHFVRDIGRIEDEFIFEAPTGIAIDAHRARLYVLDSPMNELLILDLDGRVINRLGGNRSHVAGVQFDTPTEIAVRGNTIAVLDTYGSRVQVFDTECKPVSSFNLRRVSGTPRVNEIGLGLDSLGNIYLTRQGASGIKIYSRRGELIGAVADPIRNVPDSSPSGLWIDSADRMYVTDSDAGRVHVFNAAAKAAGSTSATD